MRKSVPVLLLVAVLLLAACGPAMQPATGPETESGEVFMIALPRIIVDFDSDGNPSMLGIKIDDVGRMVGQDLGASMRVPKSLVDSMSAANVQHIEMRQTGNGLALIINGKPMPHVAWTDKSLQKLSEAAALLQVISNSDIELLRKFLPIVRRLGLDVVLTFPRANGAAEVAMMKPDDALKVKPNTTKEAATAIMRFEIKYDDMGVPGILGITASDLAARGIDAPLAIDMRYVELLKRNNIQHIELRSKEDGLFLYINGEPLPNIVWDDTFLGNAADLYAQMNPTSPFNAVIKQTLPLLNNVDVNVLVHFPLGSNQKPIAANMHN